MKTPFSFSRKAKINENLLIFRKISFPENFRFRESSGENCCFRKSFREYFRFRESFVSGMVFTKSFRFGERFRENF
jgi:hypothetical protein